MIFDSYFLLRKLNPIFQYLFQSYDIYLKVICLFINFKVDLGSKELIGNHCKKKTKLCKYIFKKYENKEILCF